MMKNIAYLLIIFFTLGCTEDKDEACSLCYDFFLNHSHFEYPIRKFKKSPGCYIISNQSDSYRFKSFETRGRLLTLDEYKEIKSFMFCFLGKSHEEVLYYFKEFTNDYDANLYSEKMYYPIIFNLYHEQTMFEGTTCKFRPVGLFDLFFNYKGGKEIFAGTKTDSVNLTKCLSNN